MCILSSISAQIVDIHTLDHQVTYNLQDIPKLATHYSAPIIHAYEYFSNNINVAMWCGRAPIVSQQRDATAKKKRLKIFKICIPLMFWRQ